MNILVKILVLILVFALLWYAIGLIPFPAPLANLKWVLYVILIVVAVIVLLGMIGIGVGL